MAFFCQINDLYNHSCTQLTHQFLVSKQVQEDSGHIYCLLEFADQGQLFTYLKSDAWPKINLRKSCLEVVVAEQKNHGFSVGFSFVCLRCVLFCSDYTMVNHHVFTTTWGICLELFPITVHTNLRLVWRDVLFHAMTRLNIPPWPPSPVALVII